MLLKRSGLDQPILIIVPGVLVKQEKINQLLGHLIGLDLEAARPELDEWNWKITTQNGYLLAGGMCLNFSGDYAAPPSTDFQVHIRDNKIEALLPYTGY